MSLSMSLTGFYVRGTLTVKGLSSIKKDSVVTTRDSSKDCILHVKLAIKCIQTSRKEKFHQQSVVILLKNFVRHVRHMLCTTFVPLSVPKCY